MRSWLCRISSSNSKMYLVSCSRLRSHPFNKCSRFFSQFSLPPVDLIPCIQFPDHCSNTVQVFPILTFIFSEEIKGRIPSMIIRPGIIKESFQSIKCFFCPSGCKVVRSRIYQVIDVILSEPCRMVLCRILSAL